MIAAKIRIPFISRILSYAFAEQACGTEHQYKDEHAERDHVLPLVAEASGADILEQPEDEASDERASDVADAAQHGSSESLDAGDEPDVEPRIEPQSVHQSRDPGEDAADDERRRDDPVDVDT